MKEKIIVALDVDRFDEAENLVRSLPQARIFKVGLQAFLKFGDSIIDCLKQVGKELFLDLKFKDIPNTVAGAITSAAEYQPRFMTIHLSGGAEMIRRSSEAAAGQPGLTLLGVTVLTSLSNEDLKQMGSTLDTEAAVLNLCELGLANGIGAFVCSPREVGPIRRRFGRDPVLVTPGIRPQWASVGDQKRVFTPRKALEAGSDFLVVGRPITGHADPAAAFQKIVDELG